MCGICRANTSTVLWWLNYVSQLASCPRIEIRLKKDFASAKLNLKSNLNKRRKWGKKKKKKGKSYENGAKAAKSGTIYTAHIFQLLRPARIHLVLIILWSFFGNHFLEFCLWKLGLDRYASWSEAFLHLSVGLIFTSCPSYVFKYVFCQHWSTICIIVLSSLNHRLAQS